MSLDHIIFFVLAGLILGTSALVAFRPRPIESAMWLILNFFLTAALYVFMGAHFPAVVQILVYAGAIMVLFVFVILLLNLDPHDLETETSSTPWASIVLILGVVTFLLVGVRLASPQLMQNMPEIAEGSMHGSVESISRELLTRYMWGFELAGVILLVAVLAVGMLAHRPMKSHRRETQS
jgi:NADH-quinone oxidoreductase subunit J